MTYLYLIKTAIFYSCHK